MEIYLAVRAQKLSDAKNALTAANIDVLNSNVDRIEPAIRNLAEGLHRRGVVYDIAGCGLFWLLVEGGDDIGRFSDFSAVECVFSAEWYQVQAAKVRYLKGMAYCDTTAEWAEQFPLADQTRVIDVQFLSADVKRAPTVVPKCETKALNVLKESLSLDFDTTSELGVRLVKPGKSVRPAFKMRDKIKEEQLDIFKAG